jgi:hypothetical protein
MRYYILYQHKKKNISSSLQNLAWKINSDLHQCQKMRCAVQLRGPQRDVVYLG